MPFSSGLHWIRGARGRHSPRRARWSDLLAGPFLAASLLLLTPTATSAGSFAISPLRLELDASQRTASVTIHNLHSEKVTVQIRAADWLQDESGGDRYESSTDLVVFPKIVTMEPGEERNVRIGFAGMALPTHERAMRVFFEELPVASAGQVGMRMALKIGVPVFLTPGASTPEPRVDAASVRHRTVMVPIRNQGAAHLMV